MSALLEVENLETAYGASQVLFGVDLAIRAGEVATLLGRNGMGKTTTVRSIMGLTPAKSGSIRFLGRRIESLRPDRVARGGVALVPEGRQIFPNLTVRENLVAFAGNRAGAEDPWTLDKVFAFFPQLAARMDNLGDQLSGGEQQMLAIGRALIGNPTVLLMDEPSEGLAPVIVEELARAVKRLTQSSGFAIVLVEQNTRLALEIAPRAVVMDRGRIVYDGASETLRKDPARLEQLIGVVKA
jgi:branched-chain amino acid transport system ATP-binding protein